MAQADIPGADPAPTVSGPDPAAGSRLKLRRVAIDTYHENVAYLHRDCVVYRAEGFQALAKIRVTCAGQGIEAVLNVVDDDRIVATDELGLSEQAFAQLLAGDQPVARRLGCSAAKTQRNHRRKAPRPSNHASLKPRRAYK